MYKPNPTTEDLKITLNDGRTIGYAKYGNPEGYPIFYFHGFPGSRLEGKMFDEKMENSVFTLYSFDRPGIGNSSFQKNRTLLTWAEDVLEIANKLEIKHFTVLGISGGGPYALACAYKIQSERLDACLVVSGMGPIDTGVEFMNPLLRIGLSLADKSWWIFRLIYRILFFFLFRTEKKTLKTVQKMVLTMLPDDQALFRKDNLFDIFVADNYYGYVQGPLGTAQDVKIYASSWGFNLKNLSQDVPIFIIHGEEDDIIPIKMSMYVAKQITHCDAKFYPDGTHFTTASKYLRDLLVKLMDLLDLSES